MAEFSFEKIGGIVLLLIILALWLGFYYNPGGAFNKVKDFSKSISVPITVGSETVSGQKPSLPAAQSQGVNSLKKTMKAMMNAKQTPCFATYSDNIFGSGLPDMQGASITLATGKDKDGVEGAEFIVNGGKGGFQEVSAEFIEGMGLCVIAGSESYVKSFTDIYLNELPWNEKIQRYQPRHYIPVNSLKIYYSDSLRDIDGNHISVPEFPADLVNDEGNNLFDGGILYTPDGQHICFFPTIQGDNKCDWERLSQAQIYGEEGQTVSERLNQLRTEDIIPSTLLENDPEGLDDDCLAGDTPPYESVNIINQIRLGKLLTCEAR
ncbi:hypothetical protein COV20_04845 [Candidatus Woesearchaeota archaeon CG10_big_fil_rev_8_21_14_0_10_45_16]|nr:MAG: hypothetical protein COV20_04845 [Candidatus Woesearchaeota archaeon CG10_big_fil_rev_8_21_14_0_10_45_16]